MPDLPARFRGWLIEQSPLPTLLVVGGGQLIEAVRDLDRRYGLRAEETHWLCVDLLTYTARILHQLLPEAKYLADRNALAAYVRSASKKADVEARTGGLSDDVDSELVAELAIVNVSAFYCRGANGKSPGTELPENWSTTTDSIAALLATKVSASELVLLKSIPQIGDATQLRQWAASGLVDAAFPMAAGQVKHVRVVSLRAEPFGEK